MAEDNTPDNSSNLNNDRSTASASTPQSNASDKAAAPSRKSERGFASMDAERQRAIASQGGKAAHQSGNAHRFTSEEGRVAGRKGGQASGGNRANLKNQNGASRPAASSQASSDSNSNVDSGSSRSGGDTGGNR